MTDLAKKLVEATIAGLVGVGVAYGTGAVTPEALIGAFAVAFTAKYTASQVVLK